MKTKIVLITLTLTLFIFGCKKENLQSINQFKFTSITGNKTGTTGTILMGWKDAKNTSWKIKVINPEDSTSTSGGSSSENPRLEGTGSARPGNPIPGIIVKGGKNPGAQKITLTI